MLVACDDAPRPNPVRDALAATPPTLDAGTPVGFRLPVTGQRNTRLYRLPSLEEVAWRFEASRSPVRAVVGFAADEDLVYATTVQGDLVALDLASGRMRTFDSTVTLAALSPTGVVHLMREDSAIASVSRRVVTRWTSRFSATPTWIRGTARNRLVALIDAPDARRLEVLADGQDPEPHPIPDGTVSVSPWGDVVAVATDSGLVVVDPLRGDGPRFRPFAPPPALLTFSASGHRVVSVDSTGLLTVIERFELDIIDTLRLAALPSDVRVDPRGRVLLAAGGDDTVHVVSLAPLAVVGTVRSSWDADLPAVTGDGSVLVRQDDAVAAIDPVSGEVRGDVEVRASDRWLVADWDPRRPGLELAAEAATDAPTPGQLIYVQVSSSHNPIWAEDFAANLRRAGVVAAVLPPEDDDELYRVVLGPHATREAAEATAQRLGLPFWIFSQDTTTTDSTTVPQ
jgi:hypothetical protein